MAQTPLALIVDDEPDILQLLGITLSRMNIDTRQAENLGQAYQLLEKHEFDICLTDMRLPDGDGIELVEHIQNKHPELPVALITAHGNMEIAIDAMKAGAFDFLSKPVDLGSLRNLISAALKLKQTPEQKSKANSKVKKQLIGDTPVMKHLKQTILKLARSQAPVYINGESGTGKELVAKLIHYKGPRADKPFVPVNCGAIPSELMESEFFGHKKGSFTGAIADKKGLFQSADGGTLFLDEIAELPLNMQVKLLRAIQEKTVRPVGSETEINIDVRILSASHKNLLKLVDTEEFRKDLFYRINVIELKVPPLRERTDDIPKLANYLLEQLAKSQGLGVSSLSDTALAELKRYDFPGNIRELENILERAITLSMGEQIQQEDLNLGTVTRTQESDTDQSSAPSNMPQRSGLSLDEYLEKIEIQEIMKALEEANGNKTQAAKLLGISFRAMRYKLKKLQLD
ncbi:sigma-54-dependent transcriptional regulator [Aliikangiella coralliicola]|uniref:Sigma-54-dependent Fis family transcriptional regulator n=1 Tax=Aliikangiella coralliicola TaxID=2592383 RepID=A0A545U0J6_9GAMM|nr:sigma-54 dependent transcriptional regulator [Aliikangiella coralliicola]TQV82990.1 sigma-54-dependent Fis family transcriptional regulator [Aliikangiella coralliicola]